MNIVAVQSRAIAAWCSQWERIYRALGLEHYRESAAFARDVCNDTARQAENFEVAMNAQAMNIDRIMGR